MDFYTIILEVNMMEGKTQYVGFIHAMMNDINSIDKIWREIPRMTILYDYIEEIMIMKFTVGVIHELCAGMLRRIFDNVVEARSCDQYSILPMKSSQFKGLNIMKEGNEAFKPRSRGLEIDWPSISFEEGVSERLTQL
jgi:hypothetical protein